MIIIHTTLGAIEISLDFANTPKTAENFLSYAREGFYNGTLFHRVIDKFMIQGGGLTPGMTDKTTKPPIENEADKGKANTIGSLAMARTSAPHSATAQFFINVADNSFLNFRHKSEAGWGYCVFGEVINGMDVVNKIKAVQTTSRAGHQDVPVEDILIERVEVLEEKIPSQAN